VSTSDIGGLRLERRIGRGGMAEVFLARLTEGPRAGSPVAVKRLLPALADDPARVWLLAREARLALQLHHPGLVEVLATGVQDGLPYLVMEYVDGCDLAQLVAACVRRSIHVPVPFALHVAHSVAVALHHAHGAGIVHCDVSPSNVFVSRAGEVKLGDFGVARASRAAATSARFGKLRYVAPELLRGDPVGPATDVFAVGAVLFELLTRQPAFSGSDGDEITRWILSGHRRPPSSERPEVPPAVDRAVLRALSSEDRYPDAAALAGELAALYDPTVADPLAIAALVRGVLGG
jgi:eukaryotic-like serine/threonine-protein kinase